MHVARYITLLCPLLVFGACAGQGDPPALPDAARFVPPAVTLPVPSEPHDLLVEAVKAAPLVTLPPPEAVPVVFDPRRRHVTRLPRDPITTAERGSLLTPTHGGYAQSTSALLRYPYRMGAVYLVTVGVTHPVTLLLPPGLKLASPPALDPEAWDVGFAEVGKEDERQEAVIIRPAPGWKRPRPCSPRAATCSSSA